MRLGKDKQAILIVVFLLISASVSGQAGKNYKYQLHGDLQMSNVIAGNQSITINYSISELNIASITNDNGTFYRISIPGHTPTFDVGKPELPVLSRLIALPEGSLYKIRISEVRTSKINPSGKNFKGLLFPSQEGETKEIQTKKPVFKLDKAVYASRGVIISDTVRIEPLGKVRNKNLATLIISPIRYNPRSNQLEVISSMKIEIIFSGSDIDVSKALFPESALFTESLDKGVLNYDPGDVITGYSDQPVKMIIITDTTFRKHLEPFIRWKTQKGYKLKILYKGTGLDGNTYSELKETLTGIYNSASPNDPAPEYLLIIGDVNKVPYYGTGNITDMYYGEFDGNGDYIPDMYIGRLPVADTSELKSVVQKIIQYEKFEFADTNNFYSRALVTTGKDDSYASYMNGQVKYAISNYLTTGNKINNYHFYYPDSFFITRKDSIMKLIKGGISFINYTGHGEDKGWLQLDIKSPDVALFNNKNMYPFVISNACSTAQFNSSTSFGNSMVVTPDKGAIGFIGCSNNSYWDEDYYWAIGPGTPSSDPQYTATGLGAYDRLFHTHGESPSNWYITMGQVNYAGNLAVSASSSNKKKYYWETYNLVGDPSIIPIIGRPDTFKFSLPDTLPNDIKSLSLTIDPFAYMAISHFDTLWDASFASPSGSVVLDLPGLSNDSCLVVITGQNKVPIIKTIYFSDITKEFINLSVSGINDTAGNNNGRADFGETFFLNLKVSNLGLTNTSGLYAKISSTSEWVTINTDSVYLGTLPAKSEIVLSDDFGITIADNVPDKGIITIKLMLKDHVSEKHYTIDICVHAPKLEIISCLIDDSVVGNGNHLADPGETFKLVFQVQNQGSSNISGQFNISSQQQDISILDPSVKSGVLYFGEITEIPILVKLSESSQSGSYVSVSSSLDCNPYFVNRSFSFRVGKIRESFESLSFNVFPWINVSSKPWIITKINSYDGNISARSGIISHNESSVLMIRTNYSQADSIKFFYKVSSELNYDYLSFRLNDTEVFRKSGETFWEKKAVAVPAGVNKMEWIYKKDNSVSQGADGAWIDLIDFSTSGSVQYIQKDLEVARVTLPANITQYRQEPLSVKLLNVGRDTINGFYLAYTINNKFPQVKQFFDNKIIPYSDSVTVTFKTKADLSHYGIYDIVVYGLDNNDEYIANDTARINIENLDINESLRVFPNPFTDQFNLLINSHFAYPAQISLINASGMKIYDIERQIIVGENTITFSDINLSPSVYYIRITGPSIKKVIPVIKIK